jgi:hypothetical protein
MIREAAQGRHRAVQDAARWLEANPKLTGVAANVALVFETVATSLLDRLPDDPELTRCLVALTQAKDHAVRASLAEGTSWP